MTRTYLITSYQTAGQLNRLVAAIRRASDGALVLVAQDQGTQALAADELEDATLLPATSATVGWGSSAFLDMQLAGVQYAYSAGASWVTCISGQDYPLTPLDRFEAAQDASGAVALLESFEAHANYDQLLLRYRRQGWAVPPAAGPWLERRNTRRLLNATRILHVQGRARGLPPLLEVARRPPLRLGERLVVGSNWWSLSRAAMGVLLARAADTSFTSHFRRCFIPSEAFVHTALSETASVVWDHELHFCAWSGWSPRLLGREDLPALRTSPAPFARKFAEDDPVLDQLDGLLAP